MRFRSRSGWRERLLDEGLDESAQRLALASTRHELRRRAGEHATTPAERVERSRIGAARMSPRVEAALSPAELLEHHRDEVEAAFSEYGARNPRFAVDPRRYGHLAEHRVIVVDLDPGRRLDQGRLQAAAFTVLAEWCFVVPSDWASPA
ncbi:hypothetical protein ACFPER_03240 [Agromyces aurantiacus]|uniref:Uncharacterized protein n=1 Tax=Agromyces aurantiacus TaxID=165814 RepID=A0ABV9R372_9MICO|nr:hypothetical protein [Agromyces aurantiacus]MBM7506107.1 hypothetical protein [Agromyces aurantiacus]